MSKKKRQRWEARAATAFMVGMAYFFGMGSDHSDPASRLLSVIAGSMVAGGLVVKAVMSITRAMEERSEQ